MSQQNQAFLVDRNLIEAKGTGLARLFKFGIIPASLDVQIGLFRELLGLGLVLPIKAKKTITRKFLKNKMKQSPLQVPEAAISDSVFSLNGGKTPPYLYDLIHQVAGKKMSDSRWPVYSVQSLFHIP